MAEITISDDTPKRQYSVTTATTGPFTIPFPYWSNSDLKVYVDDVLQAEITDYTISGTAVDDGFSGGTFTFTSSQSNCTVTLIRDIPVERTTDFPVAGPFDVAALNQQLDKLIGIHQQQEEFFTRAFNVASTSDSGIDVEVPVTPNYLWSWDSSGLGVQMVNPSTLVTTAAFVNWVSKSFVGDGVLVDFTLDSEPGTIANTHVYVDAVHQTPGTSYTLSTNTITFTEAPANGAAIFVRYGTAGSSAVIDDDGVTRAKIAPNAVGADELDETASYTMANLTATGLATFNGGIYVGAGQTIVLEGDADDAFEHTIQSVGITGDRTVTLRDVNLDFNQGVNTGDVPWFTGLGVGISNPNSYMGLYGGNGFAFGNASGNYQACLVTSTTGTGDFCFADGTTGNETYRGMIRYEQTSDTMSFWTGAAQRIISVGGLTGFGATPTARTVEAHSGVDYVPQYRANTTNGTLGVAGMDFAVSGTVKGSIVADAADNEIKIGNSSAYRIFLDQNGDVGIGASPSPWSSGTNVEINGGANNANLMLTNTTSGSGTNNGFLLQMDGSNAWVWNAEAGNLYFGNNGQIRQTINSSGAITAPYQPAFQAYLNTTMANATGNSVLVSPVTFDTEVFDLGGNFASNTFTAPVTGKYLLVVNVSFSDTTPTNTDGFIRLVTSNATYEYACNPGAMEANAAFGITPMTISVVADMDASDTAYVDAQVNFSTQTVDINGSRKYTNFSGYLVA